MGDVKDILGIPREGLEAALSGSSKKSKSDKPKMVRPKGMSREAFALLDGSHPISSSELEGGLDKGKPKVAPKSNLLKGTVTYQWRPFENPARRDGLELEHWAKCLKDAQGRVRLADEGGYMWSRFNKKILMHNYDEAEYAAHIAPGDADAGWTKADTDKLFELAGRFGLNFTLVEDRFESATPRSIEDLKDRYYAVSRALVRARDESVDGPLLKQPYNATHETARKNALAELLSRTPAQEEEEREVLAAAKRIEAERRKKSAGPKAAGGRLHPRDFPQTDPHAPPVFTAAVQPVRPAPGLYVRGEYTRAEAKAQVEGMMGGVRSLKTLETMLDQVGYPGEPEMYTRRMAALWLALRGEAIALIDLKKRLVLSGNRGGGDKRKAAPERDPLAPKHEKRQRLKQERFE